MHLKGKADHPGTAPMNMRSDAFMGLADFAHEIPRIIDADGTDRSRLTVGKVELNPGAPHTVPGLGNSCRKSLSTVARRYKLMFEYEQVSWLKPMACSLEIVQLLERQAGRLNLSYQRMPSGAGHDTQFMTEITRAGMFFVPSVGGVSHSPNEWTHWDDVESGGNLLLNAAIELATEDQA